MLFQEVQWYTRMFAITVKTSSDKTPVNVMYLIQWKTSAPLSLIKIAIRHRTYVCNSSLRGNIFLVTSSSYVNVVSLESLIIPLYNDVSLVMLMQSWYAQSL